MNHPTKIFPDYLLGLLSPEEVEELESHLENCSSCQMELATLSNPLVTLTEELPQVRPPERVWEGLQARYRAESTAQPDLNQDVHVPPPQTAPYLWLLAACVALFLGSSFWGYQSYTNYQQAQNDNTLLTAFLGDPEVQKVALEPLLDGASESPGTVLIAADEALFVLNESLPAGRSFQAWGHNSSDWNPDEGDVLDSLELSEDSVFEVQTAGFAALYVSVEPVGGSAQPTNPLTKLSLNARPDSLLEITSPEDGSSAGASVIVSGLLADSVTELRYSLNGNPASSVSFANNSFSFTVSELPPGENTLEITATTMNETVSETLTLNHTAD